MGHRPCITKGEDWIGWDIVLAYTKGGGLDSQDRTSSLHIQRGEDWIARIGHRLCIYKGGGLDSQDRISSLQ